MSSASGLDRPNVVLVVLDSVRRDHVSCYGYGRPTTPNIDRLSEEGVRFENAYSASCWTIPAHASLFTGLYPSQHGADLGVSCLPDSQESLAGLLGRHGYRSAAISCNGFVSGHTNLDRDFQVSVDVGRLRGGSRGLLPRVVRGLHRRWRDRTARDRGGARATELACRWLAEEPAGRPFFLFLNYMECHLPYRLRGTDRYRFVAEADRARVDAVPQDAFAAMAGGMTLTREGLRDLQMLYDGALHYMDRQVGALLQRLRELALYDDTLVIVTSDHGESFGEHGLLDHQYGLYEHLIAVPLVIRLPGGERAGAVHADYVQHVDLLPTLARWLDGAPSSGRSSSGIPIFAGSQREAVVAEYLVPNLRAIRRRFPGADTSRFDVAFRSVRVGADKLIERSDGPPELYDLVSDPAESHNLAAERPDVVTRLESRLRSIVGEWDLAHGARSLDGEMDDVRERLQALGYL